MKPVPSANTQQAWLDRDSAVLPGGDRSRIKFDRQHQYLARISQLLGSSALMAFAIFGGDSAWAAPIITRTSGSTFYVETTATPYMRGNYISYKITNDGTARSNVWVKLNMPVYSATGSITRAEFEDGLVQLGAMAPNEVKTAFFYVYSGADLTNQGDSQSPANSHSVDVYEGNPNQSGSQLTTQSFSFTAIQDTLKANTNTVSAIVTGPTPPELGGIVTISITSADTGNVNNDPFYLSPATFANWPADKFELFETSVALGTSSAIKDTLFFTASNGGSYTTIFKFRAVGTTTQPTQVSPAVQIGSGKNVKHTDIDRYTTNANIQPIGTVDSKLQLQKLVSQSQLVAGGAVTYTLRLTNSGSQSAIVQDFMDTLPTGVTVVSGTSTFNGTAIADPTGSGQTKTWAGSFSIPAGASSDLTFQANIPNVEGTYTNSAISHIGNTQIDSTLITSDNVPATATVQVTPPQGFKSVKLILDADNSATITAGDTLTWTISYINKSSTTSIPNFQITDLLPPNVTMTSAGAQTISINTAQGSTVPAKNTSYTGAGTSGASSNNLLASPITLLPGGVITVTIPVKINALTPANTVLSNQSIATGTGLMAAGIKTDNVDQTTTNLPTGIIIPVDSVPQVQTSAIDATTTTVLNTRAYVVSPDRDKIIINEVLYRQTDATDKDTNDEFIELYNPSTTTIDLTGWKLIDGNLINSDTDGAAGGILGTAPFIFGNPLSTGVTTTPGSPILRPGQYAVIWIGAATTSKNATGATFQVWLGKDTRLNDNGDDIWLYDSQTRIIDYMTYGANTSTSNAINSPPPSTLNLWDGNNSTYYPNLLPTSASNTSKGKSISLTPNGRTAAHISACWEITLSNDAVPRCPGALPTRDTDLFAITTTNPLIQRTTSVGVNNNGANTTSPNVLLVKRITAINGLPNKTTGESIAGYEHFNTYDDNSISNPPVSPPDTDKWPNAATGFLLGTTNGGNVKPNDSIDYTIYFLSAGDSTANNVLLCDRVPGNVTFSPNTFTNTTANPSGAARGIAVQIGSTLDYYTNAADGDFARYFPPGIEPNTVYPKINCGRDPLFPNDPTKFLPNDNGAIVVNLSNQPVGAYGFVRFRGLVK
jgi:uncharacterized repeat protein (TIGR01451 family)/fimbrial isopeptide formation D2 family protein